jgi:hypothetical protein
MHAQSTGSSLIYFKEINTSTSQQVREMCFSRARKTTKIECVLKQLSGYFGTHPETGLTDANCLVKLITVFTFFDVI